MLKNLVIIVSGKQLQHNKSVHKPTEANQLIYFTSETDCDTQRNKFKGRICFDLLKHWEQNLNKLKPDYETSEDPETVQNIRSSSSWLKLKMTKEHF